MRYSRTALKVLKARYLSILKKCALINAGLFILAAPAAAADISNFEEFLTEWNNEAENKVFDFTDDITANSETLDYNYKSTVINGNGYTLDLNRTPRGLYISAPEANVNNLTIINSKGTVFEGHSSTWKLSNLILEKNIAETETNASVIAIGRYAWLENLTNSIIRDNNGRGLYISGDNTISAKNISNTQFLNNKVKDGDGGGIYVHHMGGANSIEAEFTGNEAKKGGAIYLHRNSMPGSTHEAGSIVSLKGTFKENKASESGGAIYNKGTLYDVQGRFEGNEAAENGGAIFNDNSGTTIISNSTFVGNTAQNAGAIYNNASNSLSIKDSIFEGNIANGENAQGGAIDTSGTLRIYASGSDTVFTGNTAGGKSNALYVRGGVNLMASSGKKIVFNDGIDGENDATIDINNSNTGVVEFNNLVENNTVNLYSGTLKLGSYAGGEVNGKTVAASSGSFDSSVNFNVHGGKLDLTDGEIRETNLGNVNLQENLELGIDVNLADKEADKITADSVNESGETEDSEANGRIQITEINVTKDMDNNVANVQIADGGLQDKIDVQMDKLNVNLSGDKSYFLTYDQRQGELCFMNDKSLEAAVKHDTTSGGAFAMANDITVEAHLGRLGGESLSVSGNGHTIDGNRYGGFEVFEDQTLTLNDVTLTRFDAGLSIINEGTLNLNANNYDTTIDDEILGSGTINIGGSKTVTLNGMVTHGLVNLTGGRLVLGNEAALHLTRKFTATGGTLDIGTQNIFTDDATFENGSTLAVTVNPDEHGVFEANKLTVKDGAKLSATLAQGLVTDKDETKTFKLVSAHEWTEANEESNGDNFILAHDNNMYKFEKTDVAGEYIVSLAQTAEEVSQSSGGTANNANTANAWVDGGKFPDGSPAQDLANNLAGLAQKDAYAFNNALTALAPEVSPLIQAVETGRNNQIFNAVSARMSGGSSLAAEGKSSGDSALDGGAVWVQLLGNKSEFDGNSKAHGSDAKSAGVAMGAEKQITGEVKVGTGYAYTNTDIEAFHRDIDVDSHSVFAYGEYKPNNWFVNGIAAYSFSDYDESKNAAGMGIKADYGVETLGLQAMTGYNAKLKNVNVTPSAGLRYNRIKRDGYKDTVGQDISSRTMDVLTAVTGVSVSKEFRTCSGIYWKPEARLAMTYDLTADKDNAVIGLTNGSSYFVEGERLDRFGIEAGLGLTVDVNDNLEAVVGYEGRFREDYTDHTGMISAKYKF